MGNNATRLDRGNISQLQQILGVPTGGTRGNVAISSPSGALYVKVGSTWFKNSLGNDLDAGYDGLPAGLPGSGRSIIADAGAVRIDSATGINHTLELISTTSGVDGDSKPLTALEIEVNGLNNYGIKFKGTREAQIISTSSVLSIKQLANANLAINAYAALLIDAGAAISINAGANSYFKVSGMGVKTLTLEATSSDGTADVFVNASRNVGIDAQDGTLTLDGHTGVNIVGNAAKVDITTTAALDLNSGVGTWDSSAGLSLDAVDSSNFTVTGSAKNLTLAVVGGSEQELIFNSEGTGTSAINMTASAGGASIDAILSSNFTVSGASADLTLGARAQTITLNQSGQTALHANYSATSIIGAFNEITLSPLHTYTQDAEPTLGADGNSAIWIDSNDSNRVWLLYRRGTGDHVKVELT